MVLYTSKCSAFELEDFVNPDEILIILRCFTCWQPVRIYKKHSYSHIDPDWFVTIRRADLRLGYTKLLESLTIFPWFPLQPFFFIKFFFRPFHLFFFIRTITRIQRYSLIFEGLSSPSPSSRRSSNSFKNRVFIHLSFVRGRDWPWIPRTLSPPPSLLPAQWASRAGFTSSSLLSSLTDQRILAQIYFPSQTMPLLKVLSRSLLCFNFIS